MTDEEYVRSRWIEIREEIQRCVKESPCDWHGFVLAVIDKHGHEFLLASGNRVERWSAAAEFTRQREEEIAELREEIEWLKSLHHVTNMNAAIRVLRSREHALTALLKGWREQETP